MNTFKKFLEFKLHEDAPPPPPPPGGDGGIGGPGALPPGGAPPMGGGMPPMGGGMPPMGGGMPPMGGGMPGSPSSGTASEKLKAYNVWDVLEKVLSGDGQENPDSKK